MENIQLKDLSISSFVNAMSAADEKILSVNSLYNSDGEKIACIESGTNVFDIYSNCKVVSTSEFDPSTAKDNIIYFVTE